MSRSLTLSVINRSLLTGVAGPTGPTGPTGPAGPASFVTLTGTVASTPQDLDSVAAADEQFHWDVWIFDPGLPGQYRVTIDGCNPAAPIWTETAITVLGFGVLPFVLDVYASGATVRLRITTGVGLTYIVRRRVI